MEDWGLNYPNEAELRQSLHSWSNDDPLEELLEETFINRSIEDDDLEHATTEEAPHAHTGLHYYFEDNLPHALNHFLTSELFKEVRNPGYLHAWQALCSEDLGNYDDAFTFYTKALKHQPTSPDILLAKGQLEHELGRHHDAIESLELSVTLEPDYEQPWLSLASAYSAIRDFANTSKTYLKALDINPTNSDTFVKLGTSERKRRHYNSAIECFDRAIALEYDSGNPSKTTLRTAWVSKAEIYQHLGKDALASSCFDQISFLEQE